MSETNKLSQWHDGGVKPVHVGVYQIKREDNKRKKMFSLFDGTFWRGWVSPDEFEMGNYPDQTSPIIDGQDRQWRGIIKDKK